MTSECVALVYGLRCPRKARIWTLIETETGMLPSLGRRRHRRREKLGITWVDNLRARSQRRDSGAARRRALFARLAPIVFECGVKSRREKPGKLAGCLTVSWIRKGAAVAWRCAPKNSLVGRVLLGILLDGRLRFCLLSRSSARCVSEKGGSERATRKGQGSSSQQLEHQRLSFASAG